MTYKEVLKNSDVLPKAVTQQHTGKDFVEVVLRVGSHVCAGAHGPSTFLGAGGGLFSERGQ